MSNSVQHSEDIKAGLRKGFADGTSKLAQRKCYGYDVGSDSDLVVNDKEAEVVRWIFEQYRNGMSLGQIADRLAQQGIPSPTGKDKWNREAIDQAAIKREVHRTNTSAKDGRWKR